MYTGNRVQNCSQLPCVCKPCSWATAVGFWQREGKWRESTRTLNPAAVLAWTSGAHVMHGRYLRLMTWWCLISLPIEDQKKWIALPLQECVCLCVCVLHVFVCKRGYVYEGGYWSGGWTQPSARSWFYAIELLPVIMFPSGKTSVGAAVQGPPLSRESPLRHARETYKRLPISVVIVPLTGPKCLQDTRAFLDRLCLLA